MRVQEIILKTNPYVFWLNIPNISVFNFLQKPVEPSFLIPIKIGLEVLLRSCIQPISHKYAPYMLLYEKHFTKIPIFGNLKLYCPN